MDAHSGGMSGSDSNGNFPKIQSFALTNVVKKSLSSISRPKVYSGPLEHQLAPAIQRGNYRHAPLDRMLDKVGHLLSTNDQTHPHAPSTASSPALINNLNHNLASRLVKVPLRDSNADVLQLSKTNQKLDQAHQQWKTGIIAGITFMSIVALLIWIWVAWRCRQSREAKKHRDMEASNVEDEHISTPKNKDAFATPQRPKPVHAAGASTLSLNLENCHPVQNRSLVPTPEHFYRDGEQSTTPAPPVDTRTTLLPPTPLIDWRARLRCASALSRTNPFHDRNATAAAPAERAAAPERNVNVNVNDKLHRALKLRIDADERASSSTTTGVPQRQQPSQLHAEVLVLGGQSSRRIEGDLGKELEESTRDEERGMDEYEVEYGVVAGRERKQVFEE